MTPSAATVRRPPIERIGLTLDQVRAAMRSMGSGTVRQVETVPKSTTRKRRGPYKPSLSDDEVRQIREARAAKVPTKILAEKWDRSVSMISEICNGRNHKDAPGPILKPKMRRNTLTDADILAVLEAKKANPRASTKAIGVLLHMSRKRVADILARKIKPSSSTTKP